jgi:hypothetical protein
VGVNVSGESVEVRGKERGVLSHLACVHHRSALDWRAERTQCGDA